MKRVLVVSFLVVFCAAASQAQDIKAATWGVEFPTSGTGEAQEQFLDALTAYYLFMFEDAIEHFRTAQRIDPDFAMAYWGEALSHHRPPAWGVFARSEARAILNRLAPTPAARAVKATTAREKAYLAALEVLYLDGTRRERELAYSEQMRKLTEQYPDDTEALALFCFSRVALYPRTTNMRDRIDTAALAQEVLRRNPRHPGAPRYLIRLAAFGCQGASRRFCPGVQTGL